MIKENRRKILEHTLNKKNSIYNFFFSRIIHHIYLHERLSNRRKTTNNLFAPTINCYIIFVRVTWIFSLVDTSIRTWYRCNTADCYRNTRYAMASSVWFESFQLHFLAFPPSFARLRLPSRTMSTWMYPRFYVAVAEARTRPCVRGFTSDVVAS